VDNNVFSNSSSVSKVIYIVKGWGETYEKALLIIIDPQFDIGAAKVKPEAFVCPCPSSTSCANLNPN